MQLGFIECRVPSYKKAYGKSDKSKSHCLREGSMLRRCLKLFLFNDDLKVNAKENFRFWILCEQNTQNGRRASTLTRTHSYTHKMHTRFIQILIFNFQCPTFVTKVSEEHKALPHEGENKRV